MSYLRRELVINISFLLLANLLIKPYYIFFVERKVQNEAGAEAWGLYFTLFSLSMVPQILLDLGITNFANKEISGDKSKYELIWRQSVWIKPVLSILFFVVFLILVWVGGYFELNARLIFWIGINQALASFILFQRAFISGSGRYRWDSFLSVADKFIFIVLFVGLFLSDKNPINRYLSLQTVSMGLSIIIASALVFRGIKKAGFTIPALSELKSILTKGMPYAAIFILMVLYCRMEPVWIDQLRLDGNLQSGFYAEAYRLLDAANMMGFLFAGLLLPMFSAIGVNEKSADIQSLFELAMRLMFSAAVIIAAVICFNSDFIMDLLYHQNQGLLLSIVIAGLIPLTVNYLFTTLITSSGKISQMNKIFVISIVINGVCHLIMTKPYGAIGAAWSALITQLLTMLILGYFIHTQKLASINRTLFIFCIATVFIATFAAWTVDLFAKTPEYKITLQCILIPVFLISLGLIPVRSILMIFKKI